MGSKIRTRATIVPLLLNAATLFFLPSQLSPFPISSPTPKWWQLRFLSLLLLLTRTCCSFLGAPPPLLKCNACLSSKGNPGTLGKVQSPSSLDPLPFRKHYAAKLTKEKEVAKESCLLRKDAINALLLQHQPSPQPS